MQFFFVDRVEIEDAPYSEREPTSDESLDRSSVISIDIERVVPRSDIVECLGRIDVFKKYCRHKHSSLQESFELIVELEIELLDREPIITHSIKKQVGESRDRKSCFDSMTSSISKIENSTVFSMIKTKCIADHSIFSEDTPFKVKPGERKTFYILHRSFLDDIECGLAIGIHGSVHQIESAGFS